MEAPGVLGYKKRPGLGRAALPGRSSQHKTIDEHGPPAVSYAHSIASRNYNNIPMSRAVECVGAYHHSRYIWAEE